MTDKVEIERLKELVEEKARQYGEFALASGLKTNHYFDLKKVFGDPEGVTLIGGLVFKLVADKEVKAVGGEGVGGRVITAAAVVSSHLAGRPIFGFEIIKRRELKKDDPQRHEEGEYVIKGHFPSAGDRVALFEDTLSTGGSILRAIKMVESKGCKIAIIIAILDRQLGGSEELRKRGYNFRALLRADSSGEIHIN